MPTTLTSCAAKAGLQINYAVARAIRPIVQQQFQSLPETGFEFTHCVGIDTSPVLVVRAGQLERSSAGRP